MKSRLILPVAILLLAHAASAARERAPDQVQVPPEEIERILERFEHVEHDEAFVENGVSCTACHQVGGRVETELSDEDLDQVFIRAPSASCHFCHRPEGAREPLGEEACKTCHETAMEPDSHGPGWGQLHGVEVRMIRPGCHECHDTGQCLSCHENRGALSRNGHPPGWGAVHGVEARFDPQMCITCHVGDTCVRCHTAGRAPW